MKKISMLVCLFILSGAVFAAFSKFVPANASVETKWVLGRAGACLNADNVSRVAANGECLAMQSYLGQFAAKKNPILVIFIHGDGIPGGGPSDYLKYQATKFISPDVVPIVLIRPGYYDSYNRYSTGESYAFAANGYPSDSYQPHTVATLAAAIKKLKNFYHARAVILVGHSGGGMMSAMILGKYPGLANGAVIASIVGDVHQWAKRHQYGAYPNSLTPDQFVNQIPRQDFVYVVSGTHDTNTYPSMSKAYYDKLVDRGVKAYWCPVNGGTHNSVVISNPKVFDAAISAALRRVDPAS